MEKRNVEEPGRTPCRKPGVCDCPRCKQSIEKRSSIPRESIQDVHKLSEKHK